MARRTLNCVLALAMLTGVALALTACGKSTSAGQTTGGDSAPSGGSREPTDSGGSGGTRRSTGGSPGDFGSVGGAAGGTGASAGSGVNAGLAGEGGAGEVGGGAAGAAGDRASLYWIEAPEEFRLRAASATKPAFLRTLVYPPFDAAVLIGTSDLIIGKSTEEVYTEGFVWTEETGTISLGGLPGASVDRTFSVISDPRATSADGSVVVGFTRNSQNIATPFRWTRTGGMEAIAEDGAASAVSADGSVVLGGRLDGGLFLWTRARGAVKLPLQPLAGDDRISALALSADGTTVLGKSSRSDNGAEHLFVWTEASGARAVENPPGYDWCPVEHARSSGLHGFVAGGWCFNQAASQLYVWSGQDRLVALGPGDALGDYELSYPAAVTADGSVAVGGSTHEGEEGRVYRWTEATGLEFIELPAGYTSSALVGTREAISQDGSIVVGSMRGTAVRAFVWSEGGGAVVLPPLEGHDTSAAYAVSADGSLVAGMSAVGANGPVAVYWRADGIAHRIAEELAAERVDVAGNALGTARAAQAPLGFFGYASKDAVSRELGWRARLP